MRDKKGFTLAELLVVVAIIGVLVAISIPVFTSQIHKAEVATDWANVRAYYAEIQADYISTGKYNNNVPDYWGTEKYTGSYISITFLDGKVVPMKAGSCLVGFKENYGYSVRYDCNKGDTQCVLTLGNDPI